VIQSISAAAIASAAEASVVALAREGDRAAFEELVRRRQSNVRNLMRRLCRDSTLADDLAQESVLTILEKNWIAAISGRIWQLAPTACGECVA
jgi:DNA-directed RNA polymerase specialized sigma24 family protein